MWVLVGVLMALAIERLVVAVWIKDGEGRDHCERVIATLVVAMAVLVCAPAKAQDGHSRYHEFYREWKQPGTSYSCCNDRTYSDFGNGHMTHTGGDCAPTEARLGAGKDGLIHWFAKVPQEEMMWGGADPDGWMEIPDDRVLHETTPSPMEGHLCISRGKILCFVPPFGGG